MPLIFSCLLTLSACHSFHAVVAADLDSTSLVQSTHKAAQELQEQELIADAEHDSQEQKQEQGAETKQVTQRTRTRDCSLTATHKAPSWLSSFSSWFTDVELYCNFPDKADVLSKISDMKTHIVKRSGSITLKPGEPLAYDVVPSDKTGGDFVAANREMSALTEAHTDSCTGNSAFPAAASARDIYDNIKALVDKWDIYSKCTKTYVPDDQIKKDDVIAISLVLAFGHYSLSYSDVARYDEVVDGDKRTLSVVVSSRKENVIEGNYDVTLELLEASVKLTYTKRQNFAEEVLAASCDNDCYQVNTQMSVDWTILKLAYAGLYGAAAISFDNTGCRLDPSDCLGYSTKQIGDQCDDDEQCASDCCRDTDDSWFSSDHKCVEASHCQ